MKERPLSIRPCILLMALALLPRGLEAQPASAFDEVGRFHVQNFGPEDYDAHAQNWAITQAPDGLVYVGNGNGVLEYDGVSWRLIPVSNRTTVRSLAVDDGGRVFVGAIGELGYLAADSLGRMRYVSLVDHIDPGDRGFSNVWRIEKTSDGLYFRTNQRLFRWNGREMKVWRPETPFLQIFALNDVFYVQQEGIGLLRLDDDSFAMAPGGVLFQDKRIYGLLPQGEAAYLAITGGHGIFQCQAPRRGEAACTPFSPGLKNLLAASPAYHATVAAEGILVIATRRGGVILLNRAGRLLRILNEASGLRDNSVRYSYVDRQGGLWLGLNNGLARVETSASLSYWDKTSGLLGTVVDVARHQGRLYAATNMGVYRLASAAEGTAPRFLPYSGMSRQCMALLSTPQGLLAGCNGGLHNLDLEQLMWPTSTGQVRKVYRTRRDPTLLYLGLSAGLARMRLRAGRWTDVERIDSVGEATVYTIAEDTRGRLWMKTGGNGVLRFEAALSDDPDPMARAPVARAPIITRFGVADGLPAGPNITRVVARQVTVLADGKLFKLDTGADSSRFVPDTTFDAFVPRGSGRIQNLIEDDRGRVWILAGTASGVAHPAAEGGYTWAPTALRRAPTRAINAMHVETDGSLWVGGPHGLIRYAPNRSLDSPNYPVWIRRITTSAGSLLYDGRPGGFPTEWPYRDNTLRFSFAAPRYDASERTHYRVRLDGLDVGWSAWINETHKDYTNLWEGRYVFRVQARDVYGFVGREDTFTFRILPPWYRSWWAYTLYGLALAAVVLVYVRSHRQQLRRERAVSARLREVDRLKDEFLANTSHELRTPLYGITGIVESLIDGATGELPTETKENLAMVVASGRRLSHLVDDILDFSKLRHKSLELDRRPVELHALVDIVLTLAGPLVGAKDLRLENAVPSNLPPANADENRLQQIFYNLVGNAIKFTEEGVVEISAVDVSGSAEGERLVVRVTDTGIGIPRRQQERIFDAFEQADASIEREYGGTGLGLAVARQLVELHGGSIWLESSSSEGSTFSFSLPMAEGLAERPAEMRPPDRLATALEPIHAPPVPPAAGAVRILAVDDEPINLQVLRNYLSLESFDLVTAAGGDEALDLIREQRFDLVLLDVMMPKVSGFEVCRVLRETHPVEQLPVLFLTAKNQTSDVVAGLSLGANDYLTKPIARDELLARIRPHLDRLELHRRLEDLVEDKMSHIKVLEGILPICCQCKKIRDEEDRWTPMETYIDHHSEAEFSHGMCPNCAAAYLEKLNSASAR